MNRLSTVIEVASSNPVTLPCFFFFACFFFRLYIFINLFIDIIRDGRGLMLWLFVGPTGVYLLDFFCSGIQFNLLLSPYPCFISLLYLDLYVLGDDALIS